MRLRAIKLAGFKSFVDPTTVSFPSNLCAVVGPNGCGKSNVIDAVRWVMGESSAKTLRGESMSDVIFNGSGTRKPVGQAGVELLFDNADTTLSGEYAKYSEISIQRRVTRDGISTYLLNGQKCRRKDITDIFLGTGLGPRSYSIIEQGMISQLIDAKPEELRTFIEEAAGISKYKDRRRETERRISHTKDNLARLGDIREELDRRLQHLKRQARAAERYRLYRDEERTVKAQLVVLRWQVLNGEIEQLDRVVERLTTEQEARIAEQRTIDRDLEKLRVQRDELMDETTEVQRRYYDLGTEIARVEESIQNQAERRQQFEDGLKDVLAGTARVQQDIEVDDRKIAELTSELAALSPGLESAEEQGEQSSLLLTRTEEAMHAWQAEWDEFNQQAAEPRRLAEVEQSRITHLEQSIDRLERRMEVLAGEHDKLGVGDVAEQLAPLEAELRERQDASQQTQARIDELLADIERLREQSASRAAELDLERGELQQLSGRLTSLEALQQAALGQDDSAGVGWLQRHGLADASRLAETLLVDDGWDLALETVLGEHLQAVGVDDMAALVEWLGEIDEGNLTFLETGRLEAGEPHDASELLLDKVQCDWDLRPWLEGIHVAPSLVEAMARRGRLDPAESVITRDGIWLGPNWVRVARGEDIRRGVIKRQEELATLRSQIGQRERGIGDKAAALDDLGNRLRAAEQERQDTQATVNREQDTIADVRARVSALRVQAEQVQNDLERNEQESAGCREQLAQDRDELVSARRGWQAALQQVEQDAERREALLRDRDEHRRRLDEVRQQARHDRDTAHHLALHRQSLTTQLDSLQHAKERLEAQVVELRERKVTMEAAIRESEAPGERLRRELEEALGNRLVVEEQLTGIRRRSDETDHEIRTLERSRSQAEEKANEVRTNLEQSRMDKQGLEVRRDTLIERLNADAMDLEQVVRDMPEEATEEVLEEQLVRLESRISRLGAVNLAAIDEYDGQMERKQYLDSQNEDLEEALATLQRAIRKIDRETRTRFKETFDAVNRNLQQLFPKLFSGGHAYLEMTGEDLLDTGVGVMARPPGKRNVGIHMLSGGEKALTAIALVFAIFNLNPAPFCLLDEVDAPLDDANVGRYSELVKEMARTVQFIYITHNKIAMEMAHQMMGVTMHEAGVSRLVSVDMDEAVALAAV